MKHLLAGASLLPLLAAAGIVHAAAPAAPAADTGAAAVSEVIVTGTRQIGVKAADSAAPVQVVGAQALGHVGPPDLIQTLSQNLPSFNAEGYGADLAALSYAAALRGLNPNDTLVLIDGKRRHPTANLHVDPDVFQGAATPDLGLIPVLAIDHVEVLQDGAAAQYGSDAIAGVLNIILKNADHGGAFTLTGGQYYAGDGPTVAGALNMGFPLGPNGFFNITGEERYHDFSQRGGADRRVSNLDGTLLPGLDPTDAAGVVNAPGYPRVNHIYGDTASNVYNLFYNTGLDLGGGIQAYSFGSYSERKASAYENYRLPTRVIASPVLGVAGTPDTVGELIPFPDGFDPRETIRERDYAGTGGLKGNLGGWNWDLSTTYGQDQNKIYTVNSANASLFIDTHATPTSFYDGQFLSSEWTNNLDIDRTFDVGLASPLNVAFGGEMRKDTFAIAQGDPASIYKEGGQSYPGFQPSDAASHARTNYAGYVDFAADPVTGLHVDLAGRYEHYSDFGNTTVGKLTARYDFNPLIAIRGTVSTGFRAPTLAEEFYSATNVAPTFAVVNLPPNSPAALLAGFSPLRPEKSDNFSIGFVAHPMERLQITADAYEIDIRDRIINTGTLLGEANGQIISQGVLNAIAAHGNILDPTVTYVGIAVFTNGANTRTRGVELTASYASDFGDWGHVDWSAGFNYNQTTLTKLGPLPAIVANPAFGQTALMGPTAISQLTTAAPREKAVLGAYWTRDRFSMNLRETIYGPSSEILSLSGTGVGGVNVTIPTGGLTDLDFGYKITPALKLDVGANNLFDRRPTSIPNIPNGNGGVRPVDGNNVYGEPAQWSPFGIDGGYYYARVTYTF